MCKSMSPLEISLQLHGHFCPELLLGVRLSELVQQLLHLDTEEDTGDMPPALVAIAAAHSCAVDALQAVLGCTAGKGNLIVKGGSRKEYTIINQNTGQGVRIQMVDDPRIIANVNRFSELIRREALSPPENMEKETLMGSLFEQIMTTPMEHLFTWQGVNENTDISAYVETIALDTGYYICPACKPHLGGLSYV